MNIAARQRKGLGTPIETDEYRGHSPLERIDAFLKRHEESNGELTRLLYPAMFGEELDQSGPVNFPEGKLT